jgi:hypothetical protein
MADGQILYDEQPSFRLTLSTEFTETYVAWLLTYH